MDTKRNGEDLALEGGQPVRTAPWQGRYLGSAVIGNEELELVTECVRNQTLFRGYGVHPPHMVDDLEREARAYFGARHALAVTSGSAALSCASVALGLGPGDEVIMPSLMWRSDFVAPLHVGATPVICDIDRSLSLDPDDFERKITDRTRAVVVVHFMGGVGRLDRILEIAERRGVTVIEDCAQAIGAEYRGRKVGSMGDVGCYSFQQNKVLCAGEGGMLVARDPEVFERAARFHDLGLLRPALAGQMNRPPMLPDGAGMQFRMSELTGAVALAQLRKLDRCVLSVTRRHWRGLRERVSRDCAGIRFRASEDPEGDLGIAFYMDFGTPERAAWFTGALKAEGIGTGATTRVCNLIGTDLVKGRMQFHPAMPPFGPGQPGEGVHPGPADCPNTQSIIDSMACVMISPTLTDGDIDDAHRAIRKVWRHRPAGLFEKPGEEAR